MAKRFLQVWLIAFDREKVIAALLVDLRAQVTLAEHRIAGDQASLQDQRFEELQRSFVLVGLAIDFLLAEHKSSPLIEHR